MGYFYLIIALTAGVTKGFCGKKISLKILGNGETFTASAVRMALCFLLSSVILFASGDVVYATINVKLFCVCLLSGASVSLFVVLWLLSIKNGSYILLNVFNMLGVLVPVILSNVFLGESVKLTQAVGIGLLIVSVVILCSYNNKIKKKLTVIAVIMLVICGAANGLTDFSQKLFVYCLPNVPVSVFNFYSYLISALILTVCCLFSNIRNQTFAEGKAIIKNTIGYLTVMSLCLFINAYFKTLSATQISSAVLYPIHQGGTLIISTVIASVVFKEKLTIKSAFGVIIALVGIIINVL